jgi:phenylacetate-CoA ligase
MSREEILCYQQTQLHDLLHFVVEEVPFYRSLRSTVQRFSPFDALKEFPLLTKEMVQQNAKILVPNSLDRIPHHQGTTSGSSGNQLVYIEDDSTYAREMGYIHSQWKRVGYTPRHRKATFRDVALRRITKSCFWQENPIHNELQFSPFHMSEVNLQYYIQKLIEYKPQFLHGYPSAIDTIAEYVLRHELKSRLPRIKAALLVSESCSERQRQRIEAAFQTCVYTFYGHSERVVLGGECEANRCYHAFPAYGILEILNESGQPCDIGQCGEIVGTGFLKRSMPLIRYRTDDYAVLREPYCECGRMWDRFSDVKGRRDIEGYVIGKSGAKVSAAALETTTGSVFCNVIRFQYYQNKAGELRIRILPSPEFSTDDERKIIAVHRSKLVDEMTIIIEPVAEIPLTAAGKQRWIVSELTSVNSPKA